MELPLWFDNCVPKTTNDETLATAFFKVFLSGYFILPVIHGQGQL